MKKITIFFMTVLFVLTSCSNDESTPIVTPAPTEVKAVVTSNEITITWKAVEGSGITYNIYRNDSTTKLNSSPLTETTYKDVLTKQGSYTYYVVAVSSSGIESSKSTISEHVAVSLIKSTTGITEKVTRINGVFINYNETKTYVYNYSGFKLVNVMVTSTADHPDVQKKEIKLVYTYTGNLITKVEHFNNLTNESTSTYDYSYDESDRLINRLVYNPGATKKNNTTYTYNTDNSVITAVYSTIDNSTNESKPSYTEKYTYLNGNLTKYNHIDADYGFDWTVTSDTKRNPFLNIIGYNKINLFAGINNMLSYTEIYSDDFITSENNFHYRFEYTYNKNGYPLTSEEFAKTNMEDEVKGPVSTYTY